MRYTLVFVSLFSFFLAGCDNGNDKMQNAANQPTTSSSLITEKSVWQGNVNQCFNSESASTCLINEINKTGTPEALKAAQYLAQQGEAGYVSAYQKEGNVGIANIEYPFRANTNTGTLLIPSEGQPIDVDSISDDLKAFPAWQAFEKQHPDATPWSPGVFNKKEQTNDGLAFVYSFPVRSCHACDNLASVYISYQFTPEGKFIKSNVLNINQLN